MIRPGRRIALLSACLGVIVAGVAAVVFREEIIDFVEAYVLSKRLEVTITLEKSVLTPGETIRGTVTVVNRSKQDVLTYSEVLIRSVDGPRPIRIEPIPGFSKTSPGVVLHPDQPHTKSFSFSTDPLAAKPGFACREGSYEMDFAASAEGLRTKVRRARLDFNASPPGFGIRIARFAGGSERFVVQREDDSIELYDLATGRRVARLQMPIHEPIGQWQRNVAFSPDGRRYARLIEGAIVELYDLLENRSRSIKLFPNSAPDDACFFSRDSQRLYVRSARETVEVNCDLGSFVMTRDGEDSSRLSPDGEYLVALDTEKPKVISRRDGRSRSFKAPLADGTPVEGTFYYNMVGLTGVYFGSAEGDGTAILRTYDGMGERRFAPKAGLAAAESADGLYVAFQTNQYTRGGCFLGPIHVWEVASEKLLFTINATGRCQPCFTTNPTALLCGIHVAGDPDSGATWLAERFELYDIPSGRLIKTITTGLSEPAAAGSSTEPAAGSSTGTAR